MKRTIYILLGIILLTGIGGCRRASDNGKLDGYWRIRQIERIDEGVTQELDGNFFIAINLELMQLIRTNQEGLPATETVSRSQCTGVINYDEGAGRLVVDFCYKAKPSAATLQKFGIYSNPVTFKIETLDGSHLVLRTPQSVISCDKF